MVQTHHSEDFELLRRDSSDSAQWSNPEELDSTNNRSRRNRLRGIWHSWRFWAGIPLLFVRQASSELRRYRHARPVRKSCPTRKSHRYWIFASLPGLVIILWIISTAVFRPSYSKPPQHYKILERRCRESQAPGRGNVNNEKVFIAATLYDRNGALVGGKWGTAVTELVQLLGPDNVHVSIYENDPDKLAQDALVELETRIESNKSLVSEHLPLDKFPHVTLPTGGSRIKRIAFLAEVRNRALRSLRNSPNQFDKLLYLNDVMFDPIDAVQLLFSTNIGTNGRAQYSAVCAVDFVNAFKFYDRYATRDLEGYEMGVPFYPWFAAAGKATSRKDVLAQKDAVRVRACWGGITAFEASWFQYDPMDLEHRPDNVDHDMPAANVGGIQILPLRFRYELDPFWDASECCLIHADLTYLSRGGKHLDDVGIYTNPYVRVAYDSKTLSWLPYTRRLERLYPFVHNVINILAGLPAKNPRRFEQPGDEVTELVWEYDSSIVAQVHEEPKGSYQYKKRIVGPGRYCGARHLSVLRESVQEGEKNFENIPLPSPPGVTKI